MTNGHEKSDSAIVAMTLHLQQNPCGKIPDQTEDPTGPHASEAQDDQRGNVAAHAPTDPRTGEMAVVRRQRLLQLPRSANQCSCTACVPAPHHRPLAAYAKAA